MANVKINLILGSHAHIPYGSDNEAFEHIYTDRLRPFVTNLCKFPRIQAVLHYSGVLLHWIERSHPELFMLIEDMVTRRQIEMLGGGFYEPMLPLVPLQDKIGQIEFLTTYLRRQFGKRPQGCWIPDFAWEQNLVSPLASCGMMYTFLSEKQFMLAGGTVSPCISEDQGKLITVFPVYRSLEKELAHKNVSSVLSSLPHKSKGVVSEGNENLVSIFPGEIKSGPNESGDSIWGRFFEELSLCDNYAETTQPGKILRNFNGLQKLCFPDTASDTDSIPPRNFVTAHPEAARIYSKMVFTNVLINQLRGDKSRKLSAREEMWKAQGNSLFNKDGQQGIHNHSLRNAAFSALIWAERVTREKEKFIPSLVTFDFNMDGCEEWLFQDTKINCYVQSTGGSVFELDYMPKAWNYLDTCRSRCAFSDRLFPVNAKNEKIDGARLCCNERYLPETTDKVRRKLGLRLPPVHNEKKVPFGNIELKKIYLIKKDTVSLTYTFYNRGQAKEIFIFATSIDLSLPGEGDNFSRFFTCKSGTADIPLAQAELHALDGFKINDIVNEVQIGFNANLPFDGVICPVYINEDKTGVKYFQAYNFMPCFPVTLNAGESTDLELTLKFTH